MILVAKSELRREPGKTRLPSYCLRLSIESDTTRALNGEQGKRMDRLETVVVSTRSELWDAIKETRNFLTGALAAATVLFTIAQFIGLTDILQF